MTTFQMIVAGIGVLLLAPLTGEFWGKIKAFGKKAVKKTSDDTNPYKPKTDSNHDPTDVESLAGLVLCWESLLDELKKRGLNEASTELMKIFPMFIKDEPKNPQGE